MQYAEKAMSYTRWALLAGVLAAMFLAMLGNVAPAQSSSAASDRYPAGSFESHLDGFAGVNGSRVSLSATGLGRNNTRAMVVRRVGKGPAVTVSKHKFAGAHAAGTKYVVRAWVRTKRARTVALRVREVAGTRLVQTRTAQVTTKPAVWTPVKVGVTTKKRNSTLRLRLGSPKIAAADPMLVDDLAVAPRRVSGSVVSGTSSTSGGTVTAPTGSSTSTSAGCTLSSRGIPSCGTFVGAAHGSNTDPTTLEKDLGHKLAVHRTYYTSTGVASAVKNATADLAAGRLPWISFKLPYNWTDMANGKGDAWAKDLAQRLGALNGPVWVAFHHEPEGDGDIQEWRRMQEHLAPLVRNTAPNLAYTVILTGWNEFYSGDPKMTLDQIWPRNVKIDVAGFDIYQNYGVVKNGVTATKWTNFEAYYQKISAWARLHNVAWGLGETGVTDKAIAARPTEIANDVTLMQNYGGIAYSYFDSALNSVAPWTLNAAKKTAFAKVLAASPTIR